MLFDETAYGGLSDLLENAGKIYPLEVEGADQLYLLNVSQNLDVLDHEETERVNREKGTLPGHKIMMFDERVSSMSRVFSKHQHFRSVQHILIGENSKATRNLKNVTRSLGLLG